MQNIDLKSNKKNFPWLLAVFILVGVERLLRDDIVVVGNGIVIVVHVGRVAPAVGGPHVDQLGS